VIPKEDPVASSPTEPFADLCLFHGPLGFLLLMGLAQKTIGKSTLKESHGFQRVPEDTGDLPKHSWLATGSKNVPLSYQAMPEYGEERKNSPTKKGKTTNMGKMKINQQK